MIERYTRPVFADLWSERRKFETWLEVELLAAEALAEIGVVPRGAPARMRANASFTVERIDEIEAETHHDVVAFTRCVAESLGDDARWLHYGLTSTDVVDTALAVRVVEACDLLEEGCRNLMEALRKQALKYKNQPAMGRTHGVHAEPTTLGLKFVLWYADMGRCLARIETARRNMAVGKLSGAVGHYGNLDPRVEAYVCKALGLRPAPISTQVLQRDRHAELLCALAITGGVLDKIATEVRHWQRTELREAEEPFGRGQKGSSTMPHKRNPVRSEQISGLSRVLRGYATTALENIALWHERDISHSSAERVILADSTTLLDYMLDRATFIIDGLLVYPANLERSMAVGRGLVYAQQVMLALVAKGMSREEAYDLAQRHAMRVWESGGEYLDELGKDLRIGEFLGREELEECFRPENSFAHVDEIYRRNGIIDSE